MRTDAKPVLVVCGLAAEARIAAGPQTICVAAPPSALADRLEALSQPVSAVLSFGICGGLAPNLASGAIVVPDHVVAPRESFATTREFSANIRELLGNAGFIADAGPIAATDLPVMTVQAKAELRRVGACVAVDTESHIAAAYAARRRLPFVVIRAVCDTAARDLPPLAIRAIGADGRLDWSAIGGELVRRPGQLLQLPGTGFATAKAMRSLRRVRRCLGPRFGL